MYSEFSQTSEMGFLVKIVNKWKPIANFGKSSNVDVCLGSEYAFIFHIFLVEFLIYKDRSKICIYKDCSKPKRH